MKYKASKNPQTVEEMYTRWLKEAEEASEEETVLYCKQRLSELAKSYKICKKATDIVHLHHEIFRMNPIEFSVLIREWMENHINDIEISPMQVERMFNAPIKIYQSNLSLQERPQ